MSPTVMTKERCSPLRRIGSAVLQPLLSWFPMTVGEEWRAVSSRSGNRPAISGAKGRPSPASRRSLQPGASAQRRPAPALQPEDQGQGLRPPGRFRHPAPGTDLDRLHRRGWGGDKGGRLKRSSSARPRPDVWPLARCWPAANRPSWRFFRQAARGGSGRWLPNQINLLRSADKPADRRGGSRLPAVLVIAVK